MFIDPNPPSNVRIEDKKDTSVSLSIVSESEEFDKIFVCIEKTEIYVEKLKKNKVVIRGLEPGYQYLAMVKTSSNGLNSTPYRIIINTYPDRPKAVYLLNRTTETLRIKIVKGKGMIQWFYIQINERYNVTGKANQTEIVLGKLTPGQMYSKITVQAVSHGLYGEIKHMNNTSTVPDAPSLVQVTENTTETLHLTIEHGKGIVESFDIDINGKIHSKQVTSGSNTTNITITNLIPGTSYKDIAIISKSNGLKSSAWKISLFSTCKRIQFGGNECLEKHTVCRLKKMAIPPERLRLALLNRRLAGLKQEQNIVMLTLIRALEQYRNQRNARRWWVWPWIERRLMFGQYSTLMQELERASAGDFVGFMRLEPGMFQELW
ncbi:unnamed protein product [Mytilus coruscus]|uniref:Fibronectin type-III domain-containing protein n=1 Tax=Mytilus coruscus TaxID=42192 RepID=A0A6J8E8B4_MYTCO|nr:unnamed protein product [Mytilus coruscus]